MSFYTEPAFFVLLIPIIAIAAFLGLKERSLRWYGLIVSCAMLLALYMHDLYSLTLCLAYLAMSVMLVRWVLWLFKNNNAHAVLLYRMALALQIAPLFIYKVTVASGVGILGFLGISYITFKAVQVLIETRDGLITELSASDYIYFLVFFPTYTSGPILRSRAFVNDIHGALSRGEVLPSRSCLTATVYRRSYR